MLPIANLFIIFVSVLFVWMRWSVLFCVSLFVSECVRVCFCVCVCVKGGVNTMVHTNIKTNKYRDVRNLSHTHHSQIAMYRRYLPHCEPVSNNSQGLAHNYCVELTQYLMVCMIEYTKDTHYNTHNQCYTTHNG